MNNIDKHLVLVNGTLYAVTPDLLAETGQYVVEVVRFKTGLKISNKAEKVKSVSDQRVEVENGYPMYHDSYAVLTPFSIG